MKEWLTAAELAALSLPGLPSTKRRVNVRVAAEKWPRREREGRGGGWEYNIASLPPKAHAAYLLKFSPAAAAPKRNDTGRNEMWSLHDHASKDRKAEAARRLQILDAVELLMRAGIPKLRAQIEAAEKFGVDAATIRRWFKRVRPFDRSDRLAALLPSHGGGNERSECSEEAWDWFKRVYLRAEQQSMQAVYDELARIAPTQDWTIPSLRTLNRRIQELPVALRVLSREGPEALARMFPPQRRDRSMFHALEAVNVDGHSFDVFVINPITGKPDRPLGVFWQDLFSGKILAYRIDWSENKDVLRLSFGSLIEQYGIPTYVYLDNGRANASKWLSGGMQFRYRFKPKPEEPLGIFAQLGVDVHWTTPYHGQSKPIERMFRDFCDRISKHIAFAGHYTGNSPVNKPHNYDPTTGVKFEKFMEVLDAEVIHHNARIGRRSQVCSGRSFDDVFNESYQTAPIRKATEAQQRLWLLAAEQRTPHSKTGAVDFLDNIYWMPRMAELIGERVVIRFDPQRLHAGVHVYRADGSYFGFAEPTRTGKFGDTAHAREYAQAKGSFIKGEKLSANAEIRMSMAQAASLITTPAMPDLPTAKVVQPVFQPAAQEEAHVMKKAAGQSLWDQGALQQNIRAMQKEKFKHHVRD